MLDIDSVMFYLAVTIFGASLKIKPHQVLAPSFQLYTVRRMAVMMISEISL